VFAAEALPAGPVGLLFAGAAAHADAVPGRTTTPGHKRGKGCTSLNAGFKRALAEDTLITPI